MSPLAPDLPAPSSFVSLAEAKTYLQIEHSDHDAFLEGLIPRVAAVAKTMTGRLYDGSGARSEDLDGGAFDLSLSHMPISSITSITDRDASTVVTAGTYDFEPAAGLVFLKSEHTWGLGRLRWRVAYVGGEDAPESVKEACLLIIADRYERTAPSVLSMKEADASIRFESGDIPTQARRLLHARRLPGI